MTTENQKKAQIEEALNEVVLARLATANIKTGQPHVVPVWFLWDGESIYISAFSSTRKVKDLQGNRKCSILIEPTAGEGKLQAVLLEGMSELISERASWSKRYHCAFIPATWERKAFWRMSHNPGVETQKTGSSS